MRFSTPRTTKFAPAWTLLMVTLLALLRPSQQASPKEDPEHYGILPVEVHGKKFNVGSVHHDWVLSKEMGCLAVLDRALRDKVGSPCLALDVGMNDGFFTQMSAAYGCKVFSFEMQVSCIALSRNATSSNGFGHLVNIIHEPVSNKNGVALRVAHGNNHFERRCDGGFSIVGDTNKRAHAPFEVTGYHTFHTVALDSFVQPGAVVDFLKIDVEGHDPEVLAGADALLKAHRIKRLVVEVWGVTAWGISTEAAFSIYQRLFEYGYKAQCVTYRNPAVPVKGTDLSFEEFKKFVPQACIDWEFYL